MITLQHHPKLTDVAAFIARLNGNSETHIGYCGKKFDEVIDTLKKDFGDLPARDAFLIATKSDHIIGVCGFDADIERGKAEIWGPFVDYEDVLQVSIMLWEAMIRKIPDVIHTVSLFPEDNNKKVMTFANELSFDSISKESVLTCSKETFRRITNDSVINLSSEHYSSFMKLHEQLFPNAYIKGNEIIEGLSEKSTVFGVVDQHNKLLGYLYAEADPEFGEGSIEFFGVTPLSRNKGIGASLLSKGLEWLFAFPSIEEVTLCVRADNNKAIRLYKSLGFTIEHQLTLFEKRLDKSK
ncbi:GNAT family N-acetyltransferase [Gracilibacillus sp. S3-1-1]|uniref:GNAT family N-acetyltransferase n=1 Tax=Gracilibacillus pellucidus TaxID=3095368 RepID=A0ACC6M8U0_9BACI|nr:GNAT family N-acetyltransferase [Gracilibacillus sp. S3-1-1]MDX8047272.1 GNAT family N-acetyltransferase [Gracilibacillus sp. S3-1-1]